MREVMKSDAATTLPSYQGVEMNIAPNPLPCVSGIRKILVMGLPGAGKTTLSQALVPRLNAVHLNADAIRANINKDLGFSHDDRIEHARRMGWLADLVASNGSVVIADFICPTPETRAAFGAAFVVWVDRIKESGFEDTNALFVPPDTYDIRIESAGAPEYWAEIIAKKIRPIFDWKSPTALFVGRYQPFHDGHLALIEEGIRRIGQVCIAVRDTGGINDSNPYGFEFVQARIEAAMNRHQGRFVVMRVPNVAAIFFGRNVGYVVERLDIDEKLQAISGTRIRERICRR
jgi:adenylylsulfate kinase